MNPHVAVITLGVRDLQRGREFYGDGLGWPIQQEDYNWVCFTLGNGSSALALYPWDALAEDADVSAEGSGFRGVTLAYTVRSEERVDAILAERRVRVGASSSVLFARRGEATAATSAIPRGTCGK